MKSTFSDSPGNHNRWFRPHFSHFCVTRLGRFINESRYGGILYLALWLVVLGLVFTLFQTIFLSIAYTGRLTPDDYEVLHVEQTEYDQSIGAYDSGIIRRFSDYLCNMKLMERAILQIFHSVRHFSPETAWHEPVQTARLYLAPFSIKVPIQNA